MSRTLTDCAPIPPAARPVVEALHRRYEALPPTRRPPLADPAAVASLLTGSECVALARAGYYPPPEVVRLGCTPDEHLQRRLADQLPEALALILESAS